MIALLSVLIFWIEMGRRLSPTVPAMLMYIFNPPPPENGCDSSAAAREQQAKCRVCYCAIVRGEIWNSCTQQIEVLYVHPLRWDDCLFFFLFLFLSFFVILFIYLSVGFKRRDEPEREASLRAGGESILLPLLSLLLMYFCSE